MRPVHSPWPGGAHWLDHAFARLAALDPMFTGGWGDEAWLERIARDGHHRVVDGVPAVSERPSAMTLRGLTLRELEFASPRPELALPEGVASARVLWLALARESARSDAKRPALVVLAGSREEGFGLRISIWAPLAREGGLDVFILENPFYGSRRAAGQRSSSLTVVSDQIKMNAATVAEAEALVSWLALEGYERIAVTGYSMGGAMAAMVGALVRRPMAVVPIAACSSPAPIFTEGLLSRSVSFRALGGNARARLATVLDAANLAVVSPPVSSKASLVVGNTRDGYVPPAGTEALASHWSAELRWIDAGHVSAVLTGRAEMRRAVRDALLRL